MEHLPHTILPLWSSKRPLKITMAILMWSLPSMVWWRWIPCHFLISILFHHTKLLHVSKLATLDTPELQRVISDSTGCGRLGCWLLIIIYIWSVELWICFIVASWNPNWLAPNIRSTSLRWRSTPGHVMLTMVMVLSLLMTLDPNYWVVVGILPHSSMALRPMS